MKRLFALLFAGILILGIYACTSVPPYDGEAHERIAHMDETFQHFTYESPDHTLFGVRTGTKDLPAVIFIHGAPGDWKAWGQYLGDAALQDRAFMIAVDRPGFARSGAGTPVLALETQASLIMEGALREHPGPFILVGHSYGGPVQVQMALDYPDHVSGLVMLAGAIDPVLQKSRWYHHLGNTWLGRAVIPTALDVTTKEMLSLPHELRKQQDRLATLDLPITVIQGEDDWLVPAGNAGYARDNFRAADLDVVVLNKQGHFLPWEQYDLVKTHILGHLDTAPRKEAQRQRRAGQRTDRVIMGHVPKNIAGKRKRPRVV